MFNPQYINIEVLKATLDNLPGKYVLISNDKIDAFDDINEYDPDFMKIIGKYKDRSEVNPHSIDALYLKLTEAEEKLND